MPKVTYFHEAALEDVPEGQTLLDASGLHGNKRAGKKSRASRAGSDGDRMLVGFGSLVY